MPNETEARRTAKEILDLKNDPFETELTMNSIGVDVVFAPKAHCKISGLGAEHVWDVSKLLFRKENAALNNEQRTKNLKERVKKLLESTHVKMIGACSRRARECKLVYLSLLNDNS